MGDDARPRPARLLQGDDDPDVTAAVAVIREADHPAGGRPLLIERMIVSRIVD
jgi:hypothetical protein